MTSTAERPHIQGPEGSGGTTRGSALVFNDPVVIHCYTTPKDAESQGKLRKLGAFCRRMGREAKQGEVATIIADHYYAIRDFKETKR